MFLPTHLAAGLLVGKLTGNYPAALAGAVFIDIDHLISYAKSGILWHPKKIFAAITDTRDPWENQRNILHTIHFWILISAIFWYFFPDIAPAFSLGYLSHLVLDGMDSADFRPFYPNKKINIRGPIPYYSLPELALALIFLIIFFAL